LPKESEIPMVPHQYHVDNFLDSQGVVHKEFVPEGKTENAEFYKGGMDLLLKPVNGFVQLLSAVEILCCCMIMCTPTKLQVFANF